MIATGGLITVPAGTAQAAPAAAPTATPAAAPAAAAAAGVPVAPFVTDVVAVGLAVAVSWNPSPTTEQVTGYTVTATPKTTTAVAGCTPAARTVQVVPSDSQVVVAGLCAKVLYVARMSATNAAGTSPATPAWTPVAPLVAQVPAAPAVTAVTPRDGQAVVSWAAPVDTGGLPVTGYAVTATPTSAPAGTAPSTSVTTDPGTRTTALAGLTNGTKYTINVVALSTVGPSPAGSITVTPRAAYTPTAPTGLTATPGSATTSGTAPAGTIAVSWAAPTDNGGTPVTGYTLTWQQATYNTNTTAWRPATGATVHTATVAPNTDPNSPDGAVSFTVPTTGLEQPTAAYLFTVAANNSAGTGNKAATPAGVSPTVGVKKATVVLTTASLTALTGTTATTLTWTNPAPTQIRSATVGQVLVADTTNPLTPSGFLRKITAITGQAGSTGNTVLTTTNAALPDAFTNAALSVNTNPAAEQVATQPGAATPSAGTAGPAKSRFTPAMPGVSVAPDEAAGVTAGAAGLGVGFSQPITLSVSASVAGLGIKGAVTVTPSVAVDLSVSTGAFGIPNGARLTATAKVTTQQQLTWSIKGEHSYQLGHIDGPSFKFFIGPVPVLISTGVDFSLVVSGEVAVVTTTTTTTGAQLAWNSANPSTLTTVNLSTPPGVSAGPGPTATTYTGTVGLRAEASAKLYNIVGPYIAAELDLQTEINFHPEPGDPYLTIGPVLNIDVGLNVGSLGINLADAHATLSQTVYPAYQLLAPLHPAYTITPDRPSVAPGSTLQLTATRTDGGSATRTWTLTGGTTRDKITNTGLLTAGPTTNRTLTATVQDSTGATGQTRITIGTPFDPPGNPTATSITDAHGNSTATVTWTAPANTGGAAIKSYTVLTTPDTGVHTIPAGTTTLTIPGLGVGAYVNIYATNTAGARSEAATTVVAASGAAAVAIGIAAGVYSTCALILGGAVRCWGDDTYGQLGDGTTGDGDHLRLTPVTVRELSTAIAIAAPQNGSHACALLSDRTVRCWGAAESGALGDGTTGDRNGNRLIPVTVAGISTATAITAGSSHTCALLADQTVRCWGDDTYGQLGDGTTGDGNHQRLTAVTVPGITTATAIAAGFFHTCALLADHTIRCWGNGQFGQLGDGRSGTRSRLTPVAVQGIATATAIATGGSHTCAVLADHTIRCWGSDDYGQLGDGTRGDGNQLRLTPVAVYGITTATAITAGQVHTCALLIDRTTRCWGNDTRGQLGEGTPDNDEDIRLTPVTPIGVQNVTVLVSGAAHTCAIADNGTVSCWGYDQQGQLGDGTTGDPFFNNSRRSAVDVIGL